jgi:hypothetical protein
MTRSGCKSAGPPSVLASSAPRRPIGGRYDKSGLGFNKGRRRAAGEEIENGKRNAFGCDHRRCTGARRTGVGTAERDARDPDLHRRRGQLPG